jgi:tellurite resistance protein TehA-like permease
MVGLRLKLDRGIASLHPGYFALVMATGIVSIAGQLLGLEIVARALFVINISAYAILWALTVLRLLRYFPRVLADLTSHGLGPGFFTVVAGTCVFGSQFVILAGDTAAASLLWWMGMVLWFILIYTFFTAVTVREHKPDLRTGINGGWLIVVVATQSIAILGTLIAPSSTDWTELMLFLTLSMFLLGCMFYLLILSLIFYRFLFFQLDPEELTPPYWINMGAVAITTLAGSTLILNSSGSDLLTGILPFLRGFTLFFWATATWWIPLLLILGAWRHIHKRFPLRYHPLYWGMVFPLGMYTASTYQLTEAIGLHRLQVIPNSFFYIALTAWSVVFLGLMSRLARILITPPSAMVMPDE